MFCSSHNSLHPLTISLPFPMIIRGLISEDGVSLTSWLTLEEGLAAHFSGCSTLCWLSLPATQQSFWDSLSLSYYEFLFFSCFTLDEISLMEPFMRVLVR